MSIYDFMSGSPFLAFFMALVFVNLIKVLLAYCIDRPLRHRSIRMHGYPPVHCDVDGDFRKDVKNEK